MSNGVKRTIRLLAVAVLLGSFTLLSGQFTAPVNAVTGTNEQVNFQGRLFNAQGAVVPDGYYNIQFKIYQDGDGTAANNTAGSPAGSLRWTESWLNANSKGILVKNGYMSAELGSINAFGTQVDWNQSVLWLSVNIGTTNATCTPFTSCAPDGEMLPMKRLSSSVYSMQSSNSNKLGGLASGQFVQMAQGVQTDASTASSIFINKTGGSGNLIQLQNSGQDAFRVDNGGNVILGNSADREIYVATAGANSNGRALTLQGGYAGTGTGNTGGTLFLLGGNGGGTNGGGGNVGIDAGAITGTGARGYIAIGTNSAGSIQMGASTQNINQTIAIGAAEAGTTNVTVGSTATATSGQTTIQSKSGTIISTNGVNRATFDTSGALYLGTGTASGSTGTFIVKGTSSNASGVTASTLKLQGGDATTGNANGGMLNLTGGTGSGTGVNGLVVISTPTFSTTANDANCYTGGGLVSSSCSITSNSVNGSSAIIIGFNTNGQTASLPDPTLLTAGRVVYVTAANGSSDFTLSVNGGGIGNQIAMRQNTTATMIWNGNDWTAAGASSSTTLQSAYDNTLQSAGGAELVVSKTSSTNGLTIRDSSTAPVDGTLLSVQTSSAASLLSVNSNVKEYVKNGGAETAGSSSTTFPSNTWLGVNGNATISRFATAGNYIAAGQGSVSVVTTASAQTGVENQLTTALSANTTYNVSFATRLLSGTFTDMNVQYSVDGSATSSVCTNSATSITSVWTKVNCTFTTPASGVTSTNAILIRQTGATARTFYIDNLSVTIAADYNFATDGNVSDDANFTNNWNSAGLGTVNVTRNTGDGFNASDSAQAQITTSTANAGLRNKLSSNPLPDTLYRITAYAKANSTFNDFKVRYSRNAGSNYVDCVDYNTQSISTSSWTKVTCYIQTDSTAATNPYIYFVQNGAATRTFMVDAFSMTLRTATTPNVQIGGGVNGGPTTLLTLDKGASAPIASDNDALLGSMYYDTSLGKLQCYEADGWGACGSSPDNVVTISPEYTNAVMHGTGVGTMTSDLCSDTLNINDGSSGQSTICGTNETYNFYKWTSPQASAQTYGIYVTYQLPSTFREFSSGQTSLMARTDSSNSSVNYQIYRSDSTGLTACGSAVSVSSGSQSTWQTAVATGAADPSTCSFDPGDSVVFKINVTASNTANAYVGNLNFIFSNR